IKDLALLSGRIFLLLALLTLAISVATSWINSVKPPPQVHLKEGEEENEKRQRLVRRKHQAAHSEQASRYIQNVLKPQQEMKLKKLEQRFYQMTGETWKLTTGHKLEGDEDLVLENSSQMSFETTNREAARRRNLPKLLTEISLPAQQPTKKEVLFDWMMKIGYHKSLYSLSTSFPRRPLEAEGGLSLEDIGITVNTVLNVEEREQSRQ
ncbi:hypothetical protein A6R68_19031, partial [Neotoma lepida]